MSDASASGSVHVVDLRDAPCDANERARLITWGAQYLTATDEDATIRSAQLALEFRDLFFKQARMRGQKLSFWQCRLLALAFVTSCVRERAAMLAEENQTHVRH
jgi:hypothetical protein